MFKSCQKSSRWRSLYDAWNKLGPGPSVGWARPVHQNGFCLVSGHEPINKIGFDLFQPQLIIASAVSDVNQVTICLPQNTSPLSLEFLFWWCAVFFLRLIINITRVFFLMENGIKFMNKFLFHIIAVLLFKIFFKLLLIFEK
jgi:hypothetical protein